MTVQEVPMEVDTPIAEPEVKMDGEPEAKAKVDTTTEATPGQLSREAANVDSGAIIQDGCWAIVQLPSDNTKLVKIQANETISFGKFGSVKGSELIGMPFEATYECHGNKQARIATGDPYALDSFDLETAETNNNQNIVDRKESQKLTQEDIEQMKKDNKGAATQTSIIQTLVENSETFEQKTAFAKAKYIKRKQKKFSKVFTPRRPTARGLCEHFFKENARKICEIRIDTLSQILTTGNIHAGGRYLVVDEAGGLLTCALVERMQGHGEIFVIHDHEQNNIDMTRYLNLPESVPNIIKSLPWTRLEANKDEDLDNLPIYTRDPEKVERLKRRIAGIADRRAHLQEGGFDGLFVISLYDTKEVLEALTPFVGGSKPIVVYNNFKETLLEGYSYLRESRDFINAQIIESWLREYQLPTHASGTHPNMRMSASGGYVLSALKIIDCDVHAATARNVKPKTR
ncbi:Gcd10p family-domain-containing protein [Phlyctochytrium arcticum]|nr:Gcd10p family-domain-containing protein [Phlyctochytrium arcticum]